MKKLLTISLMLLSLTACGQKDNNTNSIFIHSETRTFNKLHIIKLNKCISVKTWETQGKHSEYLHITTLEGNQLLIYRNNNEYVLINGNCPFCEVKQ